MTSLHIGLMSGTSLDGIDAVVAEFDGSSFVGVRGRLHLDYEPDLRRRLLRLSLDQIELTFRDIAGLEAQVGDAFAVAARRLLADTGLEPSTIAAIGSHGQTVFHDGAAGLTMQIGDPNRIAVATGITVVADFRRRDLALGGQGAPLVPAFHHAVFASPTERRCVVNIGGIANVTLLPDADPSSVSGFDTGPGNALLDEWTQAQLGQPFDRDGAFASRGQANAALVAALLEDPYFELAPPKSTGRDYFRMRWVGERFPDYSKLDAADVQASLCVVTALGIVSALHDHMPDPARVLVCGGGARNGYLMNRLARLLQGSVVEPTDRHGIDAEWVEAAAFAWLAMRTSNGLPGNLPAVTGAREPAILGGIYPAAIRR